MIFVFHLLHRYKPNYNSRKDNWLKAYNYLYNEPFKNWKKCASFEVTSQKHHTLLYINDNQRYSDNKYLNKVHNITKGLFEYLNKQKM